jgi:hypothetical protein
VLAVEVLAVLVVEGAWRGAGLLHNQLALLEQVQQVVKAVTVATVILLQVAVVVVAVVEQVEF